jgi:hypothetical protein
MVQVFGSGGWKVSSKGFEHITSEPDILDVSVEEMGF